MGSREDDEAPQLMYPAPLEAARDNARLTTTDSDAPADLETPILIVGGGPVGMLQALLFARLHNQPCILIERETTTTRFPKMEYTNGRSMAIYRKMGLADDVRAMATKHIPEDETNNEIIVTSLWEGGKYVYTWRHDTAQEMRTKSRETNDGTQYVEPHMRCHQIHIEPWLKEHIEGEKLVRGFWGTSFVALEEKDDHVISVVKNSDGSTMRIKSQYVIGCDGGGSWVRKSVGLESKRKSLELTFAFVHFRASKLGDSIPFPRAWHSNAIGGGVLVNQDQGSTWTCHFLVPPEVDAANMSPEQIVGLAMGGCQGQVPVAFDEVYCRGIWKTDVAIADAFRSAAGRVFLAGDAAHQLSPVGGHGLNSGLGDAFDLAWKLSATLRGWVGPDLLTSYDIERRAIAFENLGHVQHGIADAVGPIFTSHLKYGPEVLNADNEEGEKARAEVAICCEKGAWLHEQNGNILGYCYKTSPVVVVSDEASERPQGTDTTYVPTTYPGSQAPHIWMSDGRSTLDAFSPISFNIVDFSENGSLSKPFVEEAQKLGLPLRVLHWKGEDVVRKVYERDLVLVRPDTHVAWRIGDGIPRPATEEEAARILRTVSRL